MNKTLIVGLDLSFSCTGITISYLEDNVGKTISFHRVIFDKDINKYKTYVPTPIRNINQTTYKLPTNIKCADIVIDIENLNDSQQMETTLKAMISSKKIGIIIAKALEQYTPDTVIYTMENYVMPSYTGPTQLKSIGGLIMLQGYVREFIIKFGLNLKHDFKVMTPTPSNNKLFFTRNGNADKTQMLHSFIENWEGIKLIPDASESLLNKINDVVDSFALCMQGYSEYIKIRNNQDFIINKSKQIVYNI